VINVVTGYGPEAGTPLLEHTAVRAISFTGSSAVGKIIGTTSAKTSSTARSNSAARIR